MESNVKIYVVSDSIGATALSLAQAVTVQFPKTKFEIVSHLSQPSRSYKES